MSTVTTTLDDRVRLLHATMETFADAKRFNERWQGDPGFRVALSREPEETIRRYGIGFGLDEVRGMLNANPEQAGGIARGIFAMVAAKSALMKEWYGPSATASDPRFAAWRERQAKRMRLELGPFPSNSAIRGAWNAELTRGCSGGCWFCNMAAPGLSGIAASGPAALDEWRSIVRAMTRRFGPAVRTGFLDGATDPFDHPDYESFCRVVNEEAGFFPPTATALSLRDPERSREFFAEARSEGCWSIRLTIRTGEELDALHAQFTSRELAHVQLNVMSAESSFVFSLAGRYRDQYLADEAFAERERRKLVMAPWYTADADYKDRDAYPFDANTAVVGFSIDMVDRTVALIIPRAASNAFPLGLQELDRKPFSDAHGFDTILMEMMERWMPVTIPDSHHPRLHPWLSTEHLPNGIRLHGRFRQSIEVTDDECGQVIRDLEPVLRIGRLSVAEIEDRFPAHASSVRDLLGRIFNDGLFQDEVLA